jgi:hypothetical protein
MKIKPFLTPPTLTLLLSNAFPFPDDVNNFTSHALQVKGLVAVIGIVVDNNRFLNSNAITNFHNNLLFCSKSLIIFQTAKVAIETMTQASICPSPMQMNQDSINYLCIS